MLFVVRQNGLEQYGDHCTATKVAILSCVVPGTPRLDVNYHPLMLPPLLPLTQKKKHVEMLAIAQ